MSDDKVRLWLRNNEMRSAPGRAPFIGTEYIARPVADDDAREERLRDLQQKVSTLLSALRGEQGVEVGGVVLNPCADRDERDAMLRAAQARAERAEAERDEARALLKEAVPSIERALMACDSNQLRVMYTQLLARIAGIDAELDGKRQIPAERVAFLKDVIDANDEERNRFNATDAARIDAEAGGGK